ncbi:MAG TPA: hypothetical protein EYQ21_02720 [Flavobacteriales bacterium]|nr:hypothetical protein [Flavobacteriales bacterium]
MSSIWPDILVDAPLWKWILCGGVALVLTLLRYAIGSDGPSKKWMRWGLGLVRLSVLSVLCFLLLEPILKTITEEVEPSTVIIVHDGTSSQWVGKDSTENRLALLEWVNKAPKPFIEKGFEVESYIFGTQLFGLNNNEFGDSLENYPLSFDFPRTDISSAGVVFTTDGLSNRGRDPEFGSQLLEVPHYFVGTGDTSSVRDIQVADILCNEVAYLGNKFPLEAKIKARGFDGESVKTSIHINGELREEKVWSINSDIDSENIKFEVDASATGTFKIEVRSRLIGEQTEALTVNNSKVTFIDVLESKRQVLIVAHAPHPDVSAIRNAVSANKHQRVEVVFANDLLNFENSRENTLPQHDILILHNIPNISSPLPSSVSEVIVSDIPILFIGGAISDLSQLPLERTGVIIENSDLLETVDGGYNSGVSLFSTPESLASYLMDWPPLNTTFGKVKSSGSLEVLLYQTLGALKTQWPLWAFNKDATGRRSGIILGDGIWRWRMQNFLRDENFDVFDDLINGSIQYLVSLDDIRRFRIEAPSKLDEDERLRFSAQVYDASLRPTTNVDISLTLRNENNREFDYYFSVSENRYRLDCGRLTPGEYTWNSSCILDGEIHEEKGSFVITELKAEMSSLPANHGLLKRLSLKSGGEYVGSLNTLDVNNSKWSDKILEQIKKRDILHEFTERLDLVRYDTILWLVLIALSLEWVVRRRQGVY